MPWVLKPKTPTCLISTDSFGNIHEVSSPPYKRNRPSVFFDSPPAEFDRSGLCFDLNATIDLSINCSLNLDDTILRVSRGKMLASISVSERFRSKKS